MAQDDPVAAALRKQPLTNAQRADVWDAYEAATSADDLATKLGTLKVPDTLKAELWDLKAAGSSPVGVTETADFKTTTVADPTMLEQIGSGAKAVGDAYVNTNIGALKGAGQIGLDLARAGYALPGVKPLAELAYGEGAPDRALASAEQYLAPDGTIQSLSKEGAQIAATMIPSAGITRAGTALAAKMPAAARFATRAGVEALGAGTIAAMQGDSPGVAAGVAGALPVAGKVAGAASRVFKNTNPVSQKAVQFGRAEGIPIDAATAADSQVLRGAQALTGFSLGGAIPAKNFRDRQTAALARVGGELADKVSPGAVSPEQAGRGVAKALEAEIDAQKALADVHYGKLRQIEADPAHLRRVQVRTDTLPDGTTVPIMEDVEMPVDMRPSKAGLKPLLEHIEKTWSATQKADSKELVALRNLVDGADFEPASIADMNLGLLKKLVREAESPALKTRGQGMVARAIPELEAAVQDAITAAGPDAVTALQAGRAATVQKYAAKEVADLLRDEPVQAFRQAVWKDDTGIDRLRDVAKMAPKEMPKIGRAYLDDLLTTATEEGGFAHTDRLYTQWNNLGPETKKLLYPNPMLREKLDNFFTLAKKTGQNINPSGSALVGSLIPQAYMIWDPVSLTYHAIGGYALSKLLYSPKGVALLTEGLKMGTRNEAAAGALAARLLTLAGGDATQVGSASPASPVPVRTGAAR